MEQLPIVFSLEHALKWAEIEVAPDELMQRKDQGVQKGFYQLACATANVLTLRPAEERVSHCSQSLDSHRRLNLSTQFLAAHVGYDLPIKRQG